MRRFVLNRQDDPTGVSGTGRVAEGVEFTDGTVVLRWTTSTKSTGTYASIESVTTIHGHGGATVIEWLDAALAAEEPAEGLCGWAINAFPDPYMGGALEADGYCVLPARHDGEHRLARPTPAREGLDVDALNTVLRRYPQFDDVWAARIAREYAALARDEERT